MVSSSVSVVLLGGTALAPSSYRFDDFVRLVQRSTDAPRSTIRLATASTGPVELEPVNASDPPAPVRFGVTVRPITLGVSVGVVGGAGGLVVVLGVSVGLGEAEITARAEMLVSSAIALSPTRSDPLAARPTPSVTPSS
jgi:hypothetical protein